MGLFKSKDESSIEREMKIKSGMRAIERSIRQQEKFSEDFIKHARHAKQIGDNGQYLFIRSALKKTAAVKKIIGRGKKERNTGDSSRAVTVRPSN